jgi:hypothetical protein
MKLFQKLYDYIFNRHQKHKKNQEIASLKISIDKANQYNFLIEWDSNNDSAPNALSNIIMGVSYGFFTEDIRGILEDYQGSEVDQSMIKNTLMQTDSKQNIITDMNAISRSDQPLIKPSEVFKNNG